MSLLIAFISKSGVTYEAAETIANRLGKDARLLDLAQSTDVHLTDLEGVVVGSPIYMGSPHKKVRRFVQRYENELLARPLHLFTIGGDGLKDPAAILGKAYPESILAHARQIAYLGGEFRLTKMGFFARTMISHMISAEKKKPAPNLPQGLDQGAINTFVEYILRPPL